MGRGYNVLKTKIKVNGKYYAGESTETEKVNIGAGGRYSYSKGEVNKLLFTDDPEEAKELWGVIGIKSELARIFDRVEDDLIKLESIEIIKEV